MCSYDPFSLYSASFEKAGLALRQNKLDTLKEVLENVLLDYFITLVDKDGCNLLHLAAIYRRKRIFDYLLSLNCFDLEATDTIGQTVLDMALFMRKDFHSSSTKLIEAGANIHSISGINTYLHKAIRGGFLEVAKFLIREGANIDEENSSRRTPLHMVPRAFDEGVNLLMYYGADPSVKDNYGYLPFECAVLRGLESSTLEELFYYTFDSCSKYDIAAKVLSTLVTTRAPLLDKVLEVAQELTDTEIDVSPMHLVTMNTEMLKSIMKKNSSFVRNILTHQERFRTRFSKIESWRILLDSEFRWETIDLISRLSLKEMLEDALCDKVYQGTIIDLVMYLLSYGLNPMDCCYEYVYEAVGHCNLFKALLQLNATVEWKSFNTPMLRLICDIHCDLNVILENQHNSFSCSDLDQLLDYFCNPTLTLRCEEKEKPSLVWKAKRSKVPSLLELTRNVTRRHLVRKHNLQKTNEYYSLLKRLQIGTTYANILSFDTKLYI